jgi:predicted TIM-barrel fold metal-dependent hydrolase
MKKSKIIDSHHHLWQKKDVPWLADEPRPRIFGPYEAIRRDYLAEEFMAEFDGLGVEKSVYIQCNWDPARALEETAWVQSVGDKNGFPQGIVSYIDFTAADAPRQLDLHLKHKNVKGVRQQLHWHENSNWSYVENPELFNDSAWRKNFQSFADTGLPFDLQVFPSQMISAAAFVGDYPKTAFVLNHAGMAEDRSPKGWEIWKRGMAALAKQPNMYVKFSGLNTFEHKCSTELMRPVVQESLGLFGADRCMYGSNFPIEKLWTTYPTYLNSINESLGNISEAQADDVFYNTAAKVYRL